MTHLEPIVPWSGEYNGKANVPRFFEAIGGSVETTAFNPQEFIAQGDKDGDKKVTKDVGEPASGGKFYYSGAADDLNTTMTRSVTLRACVAKSYFGTSTEEPLASTSRCRTRSSVSSESG